MRLSFTPLFSWLFLSWSFATNAQSAFYLDNGDDRVDAPVYDAQGSPLAGPDYLAELYGGNSPGSLAPAVVFGTSQRVMAPFGTADNAGYFMGVTVTILDIPTFHFGWLQIRAWDARLGATYEDVAALDIGGYGESPTFYARGGDPQDQFGLAESLIGLQSFNLLPIVPEPSTCSLVGIGVAGLMIFRRRRSSEWRHKEQKE